MAVQVAGEVQLHPLGGEAGSLREWTTTFHLALVVVDPFTFESAWVLEQAGRLLRHFAEADCRTAWLVTGSAANARQFLGPWSTEMLTFVDPDRTLVQALDLDRLPAFVHLDMDQAVVACAQGWDPPAWQEVADELARAMSWTSPNVARLGGPAPYAGSPAAG